MENAFDLEKNTFNYSISESSSSYISKKINGIETDPFFTFNENIETFIKIMFDRDREILSRFIIGIDIKTIKQKLEIDQIRTIKISFANQQRIQGIKERYLLNVYSL